MEKYKNAKRIGRGNYGTVYKVVHRATNKVYCLKQIVMEAYSDDERALAEQEVEVLRTLDHPGIVRYYEHFVADDSLCVVMAYCEGGDLARVIKQRADRGDFFSEGEILDWFVQIVMALHHIHTKRILHRDLKTQNIFISRGRDGTMGLVKLGDFGISKVGSRRRGTHAAFAARPSVRWGGAHAIERGSFVPRVLPPTRASAAARPAQRAPGGEQRRGQSAASPRPVGVRASGARPG